MLRFASPTGGGGRRKIGAADAKQQMQSSRCKAAECRVAPITASSAHRIRGNHLQPLTHWRINECPMLFQVVVHLLEPIDEFLMHLFWIEVPE